MRQLQNISKPIVALHFCAVQRCMWRFHVVCGCTTEGNLNFKSTRVRSSKSLCRCELDRQTLALAIQRWDVWRIFCAI